MSSNGNEEVFEDRLGRIEGRIDKLERMAARKANTQLAGNEIQRVIGMCASILAHVERIPTEARVKEIVSETVSGKLEEHQDKCDAIRSTNGSGSGPLSSEVIQ